MLIFIAGYPMADIVPRQFFKIQVHETFELFFDRCLLFFEKLFNAVTAEIQKLKVKKSQSLPRRWYSHLREKDNRERLYAAADATTRVSRNPIIEISTCSVFLVFANRLALTQTVFVITPPSTLGPAQKRTQTIQRRRHVLVSSSAYLCPNRSIIDPLVSSVHSRKGTH